MDAGSGLISRIVDEERVTDVIKSGITDQFLDEDNAVIYKYVLRHFGDYKEVPSRDAVLRAFPNFTFKETKEPLEYYIDELREAYRKIILEEKLQKVAPIYQKDTKQAENYLRECLEELQITEKSLKDIDIISSKGDILEEYNEKKANPGVNGVKSMWPTLDSETLGWNPGEFIVLVGEKWMGKSWALIYLAYQAARQGERVCFITQEMDQTQVRRRLASIIARVPFNSLRKGILTDTEEERLTKAVETMDENFHFFICQNGVYNLDDMKRKAIEKDATILFCDSVYLFQPDSKRVRSNEVEKLRLISQKSKILARELHIPFVVTVQAGRGKVKQDQNPHLDTIEWSNAFSQDGDTVIFIRKDELDKELRRSQVWLLKCRDGLDKDFFINQDFNHMDFSEKEDKREPTTQVFDEEEADLWG